MSVAIRWHEENPDDLRAAIRFTAQATGFLPRLLEKDYFCSVVLETFSRLGAPLVFKGGTCLAKVHSGFFRLSEDLDFTLPTSPASTRATRRQAIEPIKQLIAALPGSTPAFALPAPLEGHNNSTQYNATLTYRSLLGGETEALAIEIGLREPVLDEPEDLPVQTALRHWVRGDPLLDPFPARCLSYAETLAEKLRAALTRREVAIRDFFDIDHAASDGRLDPADPAVLELLRGKLAIPGTPPVDVSADRLDPLRHQLQARLRPVLRENEYARFDLERAMDTVRAVARRLGSR
jgi:predicted nucleotidyltransferase component of viral defense system